MRQLVFRSADVYCQIGASDRERVCERWRVAENVVGVCSKTGRWKNYFESSENQDIPGKLF